MLKKPFNKIVSGLTSTSVAGRAGKSRTGISDSYGDFKLLPLLWPGQS